MASWKELRYGKSIFNFMDCSGVLGNRLAVHVLKRLIVAESVSASVMPYSRRRIA